jgi:hypothetical protein
MRKTFIIIAILSILWTVLLSGCSRKVALNKSQATDKTETVETDKTEVKTAVKTDTNITTESDELEITPIDNSKPLTINGKTYFNARIKAVKSKVNTNIKEDKTEAKKGLKTVETKNDIKQVVKEKQTEKQDYSILYVMGVIILAIVIYLHIKLK